VGEVHEGSPPTGGAEGSGGTVSPSRGGAEGSGGTVSPSRGGAEGSGGTVSPSRGGAEGSGGTVSPSRGGVTGGVAPPGVTRGSSSAMPHKNNPVAAISVLGCTRQVPGLLATLVASAEQEFQRAAGGWHAEWEPVTALLRLTGSAAAWGAELLGGLVVDASRMAANLAATEGLP